EAEKDVKYPFNIKFGLEYDIIKYISLRFGVNNEPSKFTGGIGIHFSMFHVDYALLSHQDLGLSHVFGLIIKFDSNNEK
ncbi:MAG: hypothetical protein N3A61_02195, partial [Ignavibacteria bacterium]|nr:hypothetical protein [Ignavibacteria bacterium]